MLVERGREGKEERSKEGPGIFQEEMFSSLECLIPILPHPLIGLYFRIEKIKKYVS